MATPEGQAHIEAQERLRALTARTVARAWDGLPNLDEESVAPFLAVVVPLVLVAQRQAVILAVAHVARSLKRPPVAVNATKVATGVRGATMPTETYRRPFVTVWSDLKAGKSYLDAASAGKARAQASSALDVQMAQRAGLQAAQDASPDIFGFARRADGSACAFCRLVDGAYVKRADAMALHAYCGCSLEPLVGPHPLAARLPDGTPVADLRPQNDVQGVVVNLHGEYGPTLGDPSHNFTGPDALAA